MASSAPSTPAPHPLLHRVAAPIRRLHKLGIRRCPACGLHAALVFKPSLWRELGEEWELSPLTYAQVDRREGVRCARCSNSLRSRHLAAAIVEELNTRLGTHHRSLQSLCRDRRSSGLVVAEINSAGRLHQFLKLLPGLRYSEYASTDPSIPSEDLLALSYKTASLDLVVTSETLEHVPDFVAALREIRRVLKPDGWHIFTTPVLWDRPYRRRASLGEGALIHHSQPSYHGRRSEGRADYLVFHEFGAETAQMIEEAGFSVETIRDAVNPTICTFVTRPA